MTLWSFLGSQADLFNEVGRNFVLMTSPAVRLLLNEAPADRKSRAERAGYESVVIHIPDRRFARLSIVKQVVRFPVSVEVGSRN